MGASYLLLTAIPDLKTGLLQTMTYIALGVVAIQGILAMILFFRFASASDSNKRAKTRKWLLNVVSAIMLVLVLAGVFQAMSFNYGAGDRVRDDDSLPGYFPDDPNYGGTNVRLPEGITLDYGDKMTLYENSKGGYDPWDTSNNGKNGYYSGFLILKFSGTTYRDLPLTDFSFACKVVGGSGTSTLNVKLQKDDKIFKDEEYVFVIHSNNAEPINSTDRFKMVETTIRYIGTDPKYLFQQTEDPVTLEPVVNPYFIYPTVVKLPITFDYQLGSFCPYGKNDFMHYPNGRTRI